MLAAQELTNSTSTLDLEMILVLKVESHGIRRPNSRYVESPILRCIGTSCTLETGLQGERKPEKLDIAAMQYLIRQVKG